MSPYIFATIEISKLHNTLVTITNKLLCTSIIKVIHLMKYYYTFIPCIKKLPYNPSHNHKGTTYFFPHQIYCPPPNDRTYEMVFSNRILNDIETSCIHTIKLDIIYSHDMLWIIRNYI